MTLRPARLLEAGRIALLRGDTQAARRAFIACAEAGEADAALPAAVMLLRGEGGAADPESGLRWLQVAADCGAEGAALLLGRIELATVGRMDEGIRWLRVAADAGEDAALHLLALAAQHGAGAKRGGAFRKTRFDARCSTLLPPARRQDHA